MKAAAVVVAPGTFFRDDLVDIEITDHKLLTLECHHIRVPFTTDVTSLLQTTTEMIVYYLTNEPGVSGNRVLIICPTLWTEESEHEFALNLSQLLKDQFPSAQVELCTENPLASEMAFA